MEGLVKSRGRIVKVVKLLFPFMLGVWVAVYIFVFVKFPNVARFDGGGCKETAVFFNLFMVVLLVLFVSFRIWVSVEEEYLKILKRGIKPPNFTPHRKDGDT
ncbi:MAG: hypothetical protein GXO45_03930 [Aquificae bacterium]|nr:hypothetical protein [Aquificota bacterium]